MKLGLKLNLGLTILIMSALFFSGFVMYAPEGEAAVNDQKQLPQIRDMQHLRQLLASCQYSGGWERNNLESVQTAEPKSATDVAGNVSNSSEYSSTNIQVEGVDEADIVKTDGQYIYQVNQDRVVIIRTNPDGSMNILTTMEYNQTGFTPLELYVDQSHLILIGSYSQPISLNTMTAPVDSLRYRPVHVPQFTRAVIYDIGDKINIHKIREIDLTGNYLSSRKINTSVYLLTNQYIDRYYPLQEDIVTPQWRDSLLGEYVVKEKVEDISYFPGCIYPNYLTVASLDLSNPLEPAQVSSYLGSGEEVYASRENIYVAVQNQIYYPALKEYQIPETMTNIFKFSLEQGEFKFSETGQVPGRIINQFSMDENKGFFRIATTRESMWSIDQSSSTNNLFVLDQKMQLCGRLENIAPGEKIYSTRFMGNRAYMVTFKQVDPFFVIDLNDPNKPQVLGKLKLPGYSEYLHPYDENHIIGFGKDTVESKSWNGQSQSFYLGIKISLFDVSNVNQPIETSKVLIGDRGTYSEVLNNHKALLFSADRKLMALPVTVMEVDRKQHSATSLTNIPPYGSFAFQGLYVYNIDLAQGIKYRGRITHLDPADYQKSGDVWPTNDRNINRAIYIGNALYTLSPAAVKTNSLTDLSPLQTLVLPSANFQRYNYPY